MRIFIFEELIYIIFREVLIIKQYYVRVFNVIWNNEIVVDGGEKRYCKI